MPQTAYTYTPNVIETQDGQLHYDFDGGSLINHERHVEANVQNTQAQQDNWVENEDGSTRYYNTVGDDDINNLIDSFGGQAQYNQMTDWAVTYWDPELVAEFDNVMENGDLTEIGEALSYLEQQYQNRNTDNAIDEEQVSDQIVRYVENTFSQHDLNNFKMVMEGGTEEMKQNLYSSIAKRMKLI